MRHPAIVTVPLYGCCDGLAQVSSELWLIGVKWCLLSPEFSSKNVGFTLQVGALLSWLAPRQEAQAGEWGLNGSNLGDFLSGRQAPG